MSRQDDTEWEYGVEFTEPLNGDKVIHLYDTLEEALGDTTTEHTSGDWGHRVVGKRRRVKAGPWVAIDREPNKRGGESA